MSITTFTTVSGKVPDYLILRILSEIRWRKRIPQYVEVPPNIEAKRLGSYFSAVLSYLSNPLLLKNESTLLMLLRLLAGYLLLYWFITP